MSDMMEPDDLYVYIFCDGDSPSFICIDNTAKSAWKKVTEAYRSKSSEVVSDTKALRITKEQYTLSKVKLSKVANKGDWCYL